MPINPIAISTEVFENAAAGQYDTGATLGAVAFPISTTPTHRQAEQRTGDSVARVQPAPADV